jgi:hypothetical protein
MNAGASSQIKDFTVAFLVPEPGGRLLLVCGVLPAVFVRWRVGHLGPSGGADSRKRGGVSDF